MPGNRLSGYRSVEIRDVAGDGDFPELQGYFAARSKGKLFLHFAFMTATPFEELNIALAGPQWFNLRKDGIGFWLKTREGHLCQVSDSMPKKLFLLEPFVWYVVNAAYDIDQGSYDLVIQKEGLEKPVVSLDWTGKRFEPAWIGGGQVFVHRRHERGQIKRGLLRR